MPNTPRTRKRNNLSRLNLNLNLNLCFTNRMQLQPFTPNSLPTSPTATSSIVDRNQNRSSLPSTSSTLIKNLNKNDRGTVTPQNPFTNLGPEPADLVTAFASQRFFFTSPGRTNSIVESTNTDADFTPSTSSPAPIDEPVVINKRREHDKSLTEGSSSSEERETKALFNSSMAVTKYSPDPYADFRRSMEEMVEARPKLMDVASNWYALHELLLCYLALNPKSAHKFILSAFSDLLRSLISRSYSPPQDPGLGDVSGGGGGGGCSS